MVVDRLEELYVAAKQAESPASSVQPKEEKEKQNSDKPLSEPPKSTPSKLDDGLSEEALTSLIEVKGTNQRESYVAALIQKGVSIDQRDEQGRSFLHRALASKDINLVQALLKHGARIDLPDKKGVTPLDLALNLGPSGEPLVTLLLHPVPGFAINSGIREKASIFLSSFF